MAKSTFGRGVALQGTFNKADALWANDYNRKANIVAAEKKQNDLENQKAADYINKTLNTANAGLHRIYQDKAREKTSQYLNQYYSGLKSNPNYTQSESNVRAFQELVSFLDNAKASTDNIKTTAAFKMQHPDDLEVDAKVNNVLETGGYDDFVKLKGNDFFDAGYGTLAKPNLEEAKKFVNTGIYDGVMPRTDIKRDKGMIVSNNIADPNMNVYKENVYISYQDPVTSGYYATRGGIEQYEKDLGTPQPKIFGTQVAKESKGNGDGDSNPKGNIIYKSIKRPDGSESVYYEDTSVSATKVPYTLKVATGTKDENGNAKAEQWKFEDPKLKYNSETNQLEVVGDVMKAEPVFKKDVTLDKATGKAKTIDVPTGEVKWKSVGLRQLPLGDDPESLKFITDYEKNSKGVVQITPLGGGKFQVTDNKGSVQWKQSQKRDEKGDEVNGGEAPAKKESKAAPKAAKFPLPKGKPATVKQGAYTYTWNEQTGQYE